MQKEPHVRVRSLENSCYRVQKMKERPRKSNYHNETILTQDMPLTRPIRGEPNTASGGTRSTPNNRSRSTQWMKVERRMWKRHYAARYVTMDRLRQFNYQPEQRPILSRKKTNVLNRANRMTENSNMASDKEKTSHRVVLVKGDDQWRFEWEIGRELEAVEAITEIAKCPTTDFDWFDAAMICHEMSKISAKAA